MLWIDDVQWLDAASREAVDVLVRRLPGRPLALVLTWRPEDLDVDGEAFAVRVLGRPGTTDVDARSSGPSRP